VYQRRRLLLKISDAHFMSWAWVGVCKSTLRWHFILVFISSKSVSECVVKKNVWIFLSKVKILMYWALDMIVNI
jgi:hypothetical protein